MSERKNSGFATRDQLVDALLLEQVSGHAWRVCDSRKPVGSSARFLGFVDERDGMFEVMQQADTFVWTVFDTMRAALSFISSTNDLIVARRRATEDDVRGTFGTGNRALEKLD